MKLFSILLFFCTSLPALAAPELVPFQQPKDYNLYPGSILIRYNERKLYLVQSNGTAIRYPVAVAKPGNEWWGATHIIKKMQNPAWSPPSAVRKDRPNLPQVIDAGDPRNPLGVAALLLAEEEIAIHGTSQSLRSSIGTAASYGCVRMLNEDISDLYRRVSVGTAVLMIP